MVSIKQSTAHAFSFRALDSSGNAVTGKVDGDWTKRISKGGSSSWAAMTVTITEGENGWYHGTKTTSHTDTLGQISCNFSATGVASGGALAWEVVANTNADVVAAIAAGVPVASIAAGAITDTAIATDAFGALELAAGAASEIASAVSSAVGSIPTAGAIADAVWDEARSGHGTAGTFGEGVVVNSVATDAIGSGAVAASAVTEITNGLATSAGLASAVASLPSPSDVAEALLDSIVDGTDTVRGLFARVNAAFVGKLEGLTGNTVAAYLQDGVTKAFQFTRNLVAGTRAAATDKHGD